MLVIVHHRTWASLHDDTRCVALSVKSSVGRSATKAGDVRRANGDSAERRLVVGELCHKDGKGCEVVEGVVYIDRQA